LEPEHSPEEASRWFAQWHLYRSIVDANWMYHREIFGGIRSWILVRHPGPFTLLDLGCGDASFIQGTFENTGLWAYSGVDASQAALTQATKELAGARYQVQLREADMLVALGDGMQADAKSFDMILASYSVHHLPRNEKLRFFSLAYSKLSSGGTLFFADVFRRDGETREQYLDAYVTMMREAWVGLAPETLAGAIGHVRERDFPETREGITELAREAGFQNEPQEIYRDDAGFHRLLALPRPA
jgi:ubiquinone/menaquinone biosynthesis C-methylase UbiE